MSSKIVRCVNCDKEFSGKQALDYHLKKAVCTSKDNSENILSHITIIENLVKKVEELTIQVATLKVEVDTLKNEKKKKKGDKGDSDDDSDNDNETKIERRNITFKYHRTNNIKYGDLIVINNREIRHLFFVKEEVENEPFVWGWIDNVDTYKKTKEVRPLSEFDDDLMKGYHQRDGLIFDKNDKEYNLRLSKCVDKRDAYVIIEEKKQLKELGLTIVEFNDMIDQLGNQVMDDSSETNLKNYGIGAYCFDDLFKIKEKFDKWKEEKQDWEDQSTEWRNKDKFIHIELRNIDACSVHRLTEKQIVNLWCFLEESDLYTDIHFRI